MLVLTRKVGESVLLGNDIRVTVLADKHGKMRIGIDAPKELPIAREELLNGGENTFNRLRKEGEQ